MQFRIRRTHRQIDKMAIGDRPPSLYAHMPPPVLRTHIPGDAPRFGPRPPGRVPCSVSFGGAKNTSSESRPML